MLALLLCLVLTSCPHAVFAEEEDRTGKAWGELIGVLLLIGVIACCLKYSCQKCGNCPDVPPAPPSATTSAPSRNWPQSRLVETRTYLKNQWGGTVGLVKVDHSREYI